MDAAPELQPSLSNAVFRSPCPSLLIQLVPPQCGHLHIPFAFFCAFVPRPLAIPSLPQTQFQPTRLQKRSRESTFAMGSVSMFSPCPQPHGPHLSLGGSGLCSNLCSSAIELQAVPSIQSLQPPSHEGILGPSAAELLDEAFPRTTAKRKLDLLEGLPSFQLIRKPAVASLRQSTLRHALVSRLLILLKAAGDSCPILALADEDPWMGWQLVSDVVSGRSESTLKARLGYLERYFAWCSDQNSLDSFRYMEMDAGTQRCLTLGSHFRLSVPEVVCSHVSMRC